IQERTDVREGDDVIKLPLDLAPRHTENSAIKVDVLAAGQLRVETGADFQQARYPAPELDPPAGRLGDPTKDLEQRRFPGSIAADDSYHLRRLNLETDVPQRPDRLRLLAPGLAGTGPGRSECPRDRLAQSPVAVAAPVVTQAVYLGQVFDADS